MKNNVKVQDDTQSLQSCVSVSVMDLRIGNLIYSPIQKENVTLVAIEQGNRPITLGKIGTSSFSGFDCLQPIPLTEEWLLKCGYKKDGEFFDNETRLSFWTDKNTFNGILADWADKTIGEVKYVHQLQNLHFVLIGSELQIGNLTEH